MANMKLGDYVFDWNPDSKFQIIKPKKHVSVVQTYTDVALFSWGASLIGVEIVLSWTDMSCEQFDSLDTMYQTESEFVFDLRGNTEETYNVYITNLEGTYFTNYEISAVYRKDVELKLLIISVP